APGQDPADAQGRRFGRWRRTGNADGGGRQRDALGGHHASSTSKTRARPPTAARGYSAGATTTWRSLDPVVRIRPEPSPPMYGEPEKPVNRPRISAHDDAHSRARSAQIATPGPLMPSQTSANATAICSAT